MEALNVLYFRHKITWWGNYMMSRMRKLSHFALKLTLGNFHWCSPTLSVPAWGWKNKSQRCLFPGSCEWDKTAFELLHSIQLCILEEYITSMIVNSSKGQLYYDQLDNFLRGRWTHLLFVRRRSFRCSMFVYNQYHGFLIQLKETYSIGFFGFRS